MIYYRNVRYAAGFLPFGLFFWFAAGYLLLTHSDPDVRLERTGIGISLDQQLSVIANAYTPETVGLALLLFGVRLVTVRRVLRSATVRPCFGTDSRRNTAPDRRFLGPSDSGCDGIAPVPRSPAYKGVGYELVTETWAAVTAVFGRVTMEWAALEARRPEEYDGLVG